MPKVKELRVISKRLFSSKSPRKTRPKKHLQWELNNSNHYPQFPLNTGFPLRYIQHRASRIKYPVSPLKNGIFAALQQVSNNPQPVTRIQYLPLKRDILQSTIVNQQSTTPTLSLIFTTIRADTAILRVSPIKKGSTPTVMALSMDSLAIRLSWITPNR